MHMYIITLLSKRALRSVTPGVLLRYTGGSREDPSSMDTFKDGQNGVEVVMGSVAVGDLHVPQTVQQGVDGGDALLQLLLHLVVDLAQQEHLVQRDATTLQEGVIEPSRDAFLIPLVVEQIVFLGSALVTVLTTQTQDRLRDRVELRLTCLQIKTVLLRRHHVHDRRPAQIVSTPQNTAISTSDTSQISSPCSLSPTARSWI